MPRPLLLAFALLPACGPLPAGPTPGTTTDPGDPPGATSSWTSSAPTTGEPGTTGEGATTGASTMPATTGEPPSGAIITSPEPKFAQ